MCARLTPMKFKLDPNKPKYNELAFILSGFLPGLGQFYNGEWKKGAVLLVANTIMEPYFLRENWIDILRGKVPFSYELLARVLVFASFRIWAVYDADRSARRINEEALSKADRKTP
ncbi:MAG: hypothetical protein ACE5FZ_07210 [Nitrospiria bacterium]